MSQAFDDVSDDTDTNGEDELSYPLGPTPDESIVQTKTTCQKLRNMDVTTDPALGADEKETTLNFLNDQPYGRFHSTVPTMIKWALSSPNTSIIDYKEVDGAVVSVVANVSKAAVKLQKTARKSTAHSQMVSYGGERE